MKLSIIFSRIFGSKLIISFTGRPSHANKAPKPVDTNTIDKLGGTFKKKKAIEPVSAGNANTKIRLLK